MKLRIAFLNCKNLYSVGGHPTRSPSSQDALATRIEQLAETLRCLFGDTPAEVVALCEIGTEAVGRQLANALHPDFYETLWSGVPLSESGGEEIGLMLLYSPLHVRVNPTVKNVNANPEVTGQRAKWVAVNLFLQRFGAAVPFWLVFNHWTSSFRSGPDITRDERTRSANEIGELRLRLNKDSQYRDQPMIIIGDFNCDPYEPSLNGISHSELRCVREKRLVLRPLNRKAYFYNPVWRWLCNSAETASNIENVALPAGTVCISGEWRVFDQIMVSKETLYEGGILRFIESSLTMKLPEAGCSDHCAIGAIFETIE